MGPGTVYSRQREHTVPSRLVKPMTLESEGVRDGPGEVRKDKIVFQKSKGVGLRH